MSKPSARCPGCAHAIEEHEERAGHRVCTRGTDRPSCRACAEIRDALGTTSAPLDFAAMMRHSPAVRPMPLIYGRPRRTRVGSPSSTVPDVR